MAVICGEALSLNKISNMIETIRDCNNIIYSFLPEIATTQYQENQVECVYLLKEDRIANVPLFVFFANLSTINGLIDVYVFKSILCRKSKLV